MNRSRSAEFAGCLFLLAIVASGCAKETPASPVANMDVAMKLRKELSRGSKASAEEAVAEEPTGFATLRGRFVIDGAPPPPVQLNVAADKEVCAPGGKPVFAHPVLVDDSTGGIANVVIYARNIKPEHAHEEMAPGKTDEVEFDQENCVFETHVLAMQTSQTVKVLNSDPVGHNTNIADAGFNATIPANGSVMFTAQREASLPIRAVCNIHPWMLAYMLPRDDSYFAVTKADGSFEIPNLPAGVTIEFQVWQEKTGPLQRVSLDGTSTAWKSGRFKLKLEPDQAKELAVTVPAVVFQ